MQHPPVGGPQSHPSVLKWNKQPVWILPLELLWASFSIFSACESLDTIQIRCPNSNGYFWTHHFFLKAYHLFTTLPSPYLLPAQCHQSGLCHPKPTKNAASTRDTGSWVSLGHSLASICHRKNELNQIISLTSSFIFEWSEGSLERSIKRNEIYFSSFQLEL